MSKIEILRKLREELEQLRQKIMNLEIFLQTNKFLNISLSNKIQTELLREQLKTMEKYQNILISRIALIQDDIDKGEE